MNQMRFFMAPSSRFQLEIYAEEWGFAFRHERKISWIRVTDIAFVHGRDDFGLLDERPRLQDIAPFIRRLEERYRQAVTR